MGILAVKGIRTFITDVASKWKWRFESKPGCYLREFGCVEQCQHRLVNVPLTPDPGQPWCSNKGVGDLETKGHVGFDRPGKGRSQLGTGERH